MAEKLPPHIVDETVICVRRKHWISIAPIMLSTAILALLLPIGSYFYAQNTDRVHRIIPAAAIGSLTLAYIVLVAGIAFLSLWIYRQNRLILTNHHIVEYARHGLFDHSTSQFSLIKLQDVSATQNGVIANLLGYGTIEIQTASEEDNFVFTQVPAPQALADQIMQAHESLGISTPAAEVKSV